MLATKSIEKMAAEDLTLAFEFAGELAAGETLSAAGTLSAEPDGLTLGDRVAATISGTQVMFSAKGGADLQTYKITLVGVTTSAGNKLGAQGNLDVVG
ncbi:MAG TPA: hypothetical protein VFX03_03025 [Thermomicrobiales bacterium]|nr:hypothetical protein [Thermomicrobiales bacterium]